MRAFIRQTLTPPISPAARTALNTYIESDEFRCSRRMAAEDLAIALRDEMIASIPGLSGVAKETIQGGLRMFEREWPQQLEEPAPLPLPPSVRSIAVTCLCAE